LDWQNVLAVAAGGAIGSVLRYAVGFAFIQRFGPGFPWGTLFINVTGSLLIGIVAELTATRVFGISPLVRVLLAVGLLGGYTTFSTFALDALTLVAERAQVLAVAYALASVLLSILAAFAGVVIVRAVASFT